MDSDVHHADRFDVSGPAHIMSRATAGGSSPTMIDWYVHVMCASYV
jgi:hypothetical protein